MRETSETSTEAPALRTSATRVLSILDIIFLIALALESRSDISIARMCGRGCAIGGHPAAAPVADRLVGPDVAGERR